MTASHCFKAVARVVPMIASFGMFAGLAMAGAVVPAGDSGGNAARSRVASSGGAQSRSGDNGVGRRVDADDPFGPSEPVVEIGIDPTRFDEHEWMIGELFAESFGRGRLILEDGDVLRGRVVTEGFDIRPGATVYIEEGTTLIAMGDCWLNGPLVPFALDEAEFAAEMAESNGADAEGEVVDLFKDLAEVIDFSQLSDEEIEEIVAMAASAPICPAEVKQIGKGGRKPKEVKMFVNGTMNINAPIGACAGPAAGQAPNPVAVTVAGARSARAIGGKGGHGVDVNIQALGNSIMNINANLCNGEGHKGADATATGAAGAPCDCGGDAYADAGDGGDAGFLFVAAGTINWGVGGSVTVKNGGAGGIATATGGAGGDCDVCGGVGGRGGNATARAGRAGGDSRITVTARAAMNPGPAVALANNVFFAAPASGGAATATAGKGGRGGHCLDCNLKGGNGGPGGTSLAVGARGGHGLLLAASVNGNIVGYKSSNGGNGGAATAVPGQGGNGGNGGTCPCTFPGQAGRGGDGGTSGDAKAFGGDGGTARKGQTAGVPQNTPTSGNGGNAVANCVVGGAGANGGNCVVDWPDPCVVGALGKGGPGGKATKRGGRKGSAFNGATSGTPGTPTSVQTTICGKGPDGIPGLKSCTPPPPPDDDCCVPGTVPGCDDRGCENSVCPIVPSCCDLLWDGLCAALANELCAVCGAPFTCTPSAVDEGEPCGADINGGCNSAPPQFQPLFFGQPVCGTAWALDGVRDTDWYEVFVEQPSIVTFTVRNQLPMVIGLVNTGGIPNCDQATSLDPVALSPADGTATFTACVQPGVYWFFAAPDGFDGYACGSNFNRYEVTLEQTGACQTVANDECGGAFLIGLGPTPFSTLGATTSEPPLFNQCDEGFGLNLVNDVWFIHQVTQPGQLVISTCGSADFDTRLAVYDAVCGGPLLGCSDDAPNCPGATSMVVLPVAPGQKLLIRLGGYSGSGSGVLQVHYGGDA